MYNMNDLVLGAVFLTPSVAAVVLLWAVTLIRRAPVGH